MEQHTGSQYDDDLTVGMDEYDDSLQTDNVDLFEFVSDEESPITRLKTIILSIDWEITDDILRQFNMELLDLKDIWANEKVNLVYIQALEKISKYIYKEKANSDPNAIKLLMHFYSNLEKIVLTKSITEEEKKRLLIEDVEKFEKFKKKISPAQGKTERQKSTAAAPSITAPSSRLNGPLSAEEENEDPLLNLKAIVFGMDWEITETDLINLGEEVRNLEKRFSNSKAKLIFLQGIGALGAYINLKRSNAHADAFKLLHSFFLSLENVVRHNLTGEEEKRILMPEVEKFNAFKTIIASTISPEAIAAEGEQEDEDIDLDYPTADEALAPAFADMPEEIHGFQEEEEAESLGYEVKQKVDGQIDRFFDSERPPAGEDAHDVKKVERKKNELIDEMESRLDGFFGEDSELSQIGGTSQEVALQGVDVETEADDDSGEEELLRFGDELAPALAENFEESTFAEPSVVVDLSENGSSFELDAQDTSGEKDISGKTQAIEDASVALQGIEVETEADDDSGEEPLPLKGEELAPALYAVDDSEIGVAEKDLFQEEESLGIEDRLEEFFGDDSERIQTVEEPEAVTFAPEDLEEPETVAFASDGLEEPETVAFASEELEEPETVAFASDGLEEPETVAFASDGLEEPETVAFTPEELEEPETVAFASEELEEPETVAFTPEELEEPETVAFASEELEEPEAVAFASDGLEEPETVAFTPEELEEPETVAFASEELEEPETVAFTPEELEEPETVAFASEELEEPEAVAFASDGLEEPETVAFTPEELEEPETVAFASDGLEEPEAVAFASEELEEPEAVAFASEELEEPEAVAFASEELEEPETVAFVPEELEEPETVAFASEELEEPEAVAFASEELEEPETVAFVPEELEEPETVAFASEELEEPETVAFAPEGLEEPNEDLFADEEATVSKDDLFISEKPSLTTGSEAEPAETLTILQEDEDFIEYIEGVDFDREEEHRETVFEAVGEVEEVVFEPVDEENISETEGEEQVFFDEVEDELDKYFAESESISDQRGGGTEESARDEEYFGSPNIFGESFNEDQGLIGSEIRMEVFPEDSKPEEIRISEEFDFSLAEDAGLLGEIEAEKSEVFFGSELSSSMDLDPLSPLRDCVASLGQEVNDTLLGNFFDEINNLNNLWMTKPVEKIFLQLLSTVAQHIYDYRHEASPEAHALLMSVFNKLELSRLDGAEAMAVHESLLSETSRILLWQQRMLTRSATRRGDDSSTSIEADDHVSGVDDFEQFNLMEHDRKDYVVSQEEDQDQKKEGEPDKMEKPSAEGLDEEKISRIVRDELEILRQSFRTEMSELLRRHLDKGPPEKTD